MSQTETFDETEVDCPRCGEEVLAYELIHTPEGTFCIGCNPGYQECQWCERAVREPLDEVAIGPEDLAMCRICPSCWAKWIAATEALRETLKPKTKSGKNPAPQEASC